MLGFSYIGLFVFALLVVIIFIGRKDVYRLLFSERLKIRILSWAIAYALCVSWIIEPLTLLSDRFPSGDVESIPEKYIGNWGYDLTMHDSEALRVSHDSLKYTVVDEGEKFTTKCNLPRIDYGFSNLKQLHGHTLWYSLFYNWLQWFVPVTVFGNQEIRWDCGKYSNAPDSDLRFWLMLGEPTIKLGNGYDTIGLVLHDPSWILAVDSGKRQLLTTVFERQMRTK